jgi:Domain of unknown function (DUF4276)
MVTRKIYVEGGGDRSAQKSVCRQAFSKLFEKMGYVNNMPRIMPRGGREIAFDDFTTSLGIANQDTEVYLLVDSEDTVTDIENPWGHLKTRDDWDCPRGTDNDHVFLMTTSMETWLCADPESLKSHYKKGFAASKLPKHANPEQKPRDETLESLEKATKDCKNRYKKGVRSFEVLEVLNPDVLARKLPSFKRMKRILDREILGTLPPNS